jgi:DNA-binding transcriptional ArsR family regulator
MSSRTPKPSAVSPVKPGATAARLRHQAPLFAALGDRTRLILVHRLSSGPPRSISQLTHGTRITRQAITRHLRVLEDAGIVRSLRSGRESLFEFNPKVIGDLQDYLAFVSSQWDDALLRLKSFVED